MKKKIKSQQVDNLLNGDAFRIDDETRLMLTTKGIVPEEFINSGNSLQYRTPKTEKQLIDNAFVDLHKAIVSIPHRID